MSREMRCHTDDNAIVMLLVSVLEFLLVLYNSRTVLTHQPIAFAETKQLHSTTKRLCCLVGLQLVRLYGAKGPRVFCRRLVMGTTSGEIKNHSSKKYCL